MAKAANDETTKSSTFEDIYGPLPFPSPAGPDVRVPHRRLAVNLSLEGLPNFGGSGLGGRGGVVIERGGGREESVGSRDPAKVFSLELSIFGGSSPLPSSAPGPSWRRRSAPAWRARCFATAPPPTRWVSPSPPAQFIRVLAAVQRLSIHTAIQRGEALPI